MSVSECLCVFVCVCVCLWVCGCVGLWVCGCVCSLQGVVLVCVSVDKKLLHQEKDAKFLKYKNKIQMFDPFQQSDMTFCLPTSRLLTSSLHSIRWIKFEPGRVCVL